MDRVIVRAKSKSAVQRLALHAIVENPVGSSFQRALPAVFRK